MELAVRRNPTLAYPLRVAGWRKVRGWLEAQPTFVYNWFGLHLIDVQNHCTDTMMLTGFVSNYDNYLMILSHQEINYSTPFVTQTFESGTAEYKKQYAYSTEVKCCPLSCPTISKPGKPIRD
jgi:hypothetical protein